MYFEFYSFHERPFNLTPDPRFIYLSQNHREAFAHLLFGIENRAGFISLTGEVGTGKTTVLRTLLNQLDPDRYRTALIFNPPLSPAQLLDGIIREYGIDPAGSESRSPLEALNRFLLQENASGRTVVLVIDEAQDLDESVLEQIRLISNLETDSQKLIQIILAGQPEFLQKLKKKELRQLSQRITVRYHLQPLNIRDTADYINHRLDVAKGRAVFSSRALSRIYRYSRGLPRLINASCDRALLAGYTRNSLEITARIAAAGIAELKKNARTFTAAPRPVFYSVLALAIAGLVAVAFLSVAGPNTFRLNTAKVFAPDRPLPVQEPSRITKEQPLAGGIALMEKYSEQETARAAFNVMARLWKVTPLSESIDSSGTDLTRPGTLIRAVHDRGLRVYRFSGDFGTLLRMDSPAILEFVLPGKSGKRFAAIVTAKNGDVVIRPALGGQEVFPVNEVEKFWSGNAFVFWRNPLHLPGKVAPGSRGIQVRQVQNLLREAGLFPLPSTGVFDSQTGSAVRTFQSRNGVEQDGIVGTRTLMLLYCSNRHFGFPRLSEQVAP